MKKTILSSVCALLAFAIIIAAVSLASAAAVPEYNSAVGYEYSTEKVKGEAIIKAASERDDTVFLFGSSELSTTMIQSHPANFFTENDFGFHVCTVGRGSSQSLIHALILAGNAKSLQDKKIVFLISPQHFVKDGIEPDMFVANFSQQQFLDAMECDLLSEDEKLYMATRVRDCFERYQSEFEDPGFEDSRRLAEQVLVSGSDIPSVILALMKPYYAFESLLFTIRDNFSSSVVMTEAESVEGQAAVGFDFNNYRAEMTSLGEKESDNNDFGILNDYYTTNVGAKLARMKDKDKVLDYSQSIEYEDLSLLIKLCDSLNIDALFVHTPLNGKWSDYCGFTAEKRAEYYDNVREMLDASGYKYLDLTANEYQSYYLCDVMHLGWLGWVDINEAICEFYNEN